MTTNTLLRAESWPVLFNHIAGWDWDGSRLAIVPGEDEKRAAAAALNLKVENNIFTLWDLVGRYTVTSLGGTNLINLQEIETILGEVFEEGITPYLHIDRQRQGYLRALAGFAEWLNKFLGISFQLGGERGVIKYVNRGGLWMTIPYRMFSEEEINTGPGEAYRTEFPVEGCEVCHD